MRRGWGVAGESRDEWTEKGSDQDRKAVLSIMSLSLKKKKKADKAGRRDERGNREKELDTCSTRGECVENKAGGVL